MKKNTIILGAAGRDFHNFNVFFKNNSFYNIVCFTAAQIQGISNRTYPSILSGKLYPRGIPIHAEKDLPELVKKHNVSQVVLSYSDLSHEDVMQKAELVLSLGASFLLLGSKDTMIESKKPVIAVCAVRTGAGKSQTTRRIIQLLSSKGKKVVAVRHPMPYGDLKKQIVQRYSSISDLEKFNTTIEEREEYEPLIKMGAVVYSGVDYKKILLQAEKEADVIVWDGGNNDLPFYKPKLFIVVADPLRPGHELKYYPGESNFLSADCILINKINSAKPKNIERIVKNAKKFNPKALIVKASSEIFGIGLQKIRNKKVLVVEDGPSLTHGGMPFGAGAIVARKFGGKMVSPERHSTGSLKEVFKKYKHLRNILPAMGYSPVQIKELEQAINKTKADYVVSATPIDLNLVLKSNKPILHARYELKIKGTPNLETVLKKFGFL